MVARGILCLGLMFGAAAAPLAARAEQQPAIVLSPTGQWVLEMADDKCRISRVFGEDDQRTAFYIEQWTPSSEALLAIAGPAVKNYRPRRPTKIGFGPDGDSRELEIREFSLKGFGNAVTFRSSVAKAPTQSDQAPVGAAYRRLPRMHQEQAGGIDRLTIAQRGRPTVTLELGDMRRPLTAMNLCMEDLVEHWGFDPDEQRTIVTPARIDGWDRIVGTIQSQYPSSASDKGAQADFQLRLNIGLDGTIEDCKLVNLTFADDFDMARHPCQAFRRYASIEPARDAQGNPVRTYYTTTIVYTMSVF